MAYNLVLASLEALNDSDGLPVNGYLHAYTKGTQTYSDIRSADDFTTSVANPMPVVQGRAQVPFVASEDLTLVLKDENESVIRTESWIYPTIGITQQGSSIPAYATLEAMKASLVTAGTMVFLQGYYAAGDKPVRAYIATSEELQDDDGFYIVGTNINFRCVNTELDSRDYGIFPQSTQEAAHEYYDASRFANLAHQADVLDAYINFEQGYYEVPLGLSFKARGNGCLCPNGAVELTVTSNVSIGQYYNGTELASGIVDTLTADKYSTGYIDPNVHVGTFNVKHLIISSNIDITLVDAIAEFTITHTKSRYLTNCVIQSASLLSTESGSTELLIGCEINEGAFVSGYAFNGTYRNCTIGIFSSPDRLLKVAASIGTYADLKNLTVDSNVSITTQHNLIISNGGFEADVSVPYGVSDTHLILMNCTIDDTASFTNWADVILINCEVSQTWLAAHSSQVYNLGKRLNVDQIVCGGIVAAAQFQAEYAKLTHTLDKNKGSLITGETYKYHFTTSDYMGQDNVPQGYSEKLHFKNDCGNLAYICIGYWEDSGTRYRAYAMLNVDSSWDLEKVAEYTVSATHQGSAVTAHLFFSDYLSGPISGSAIETLEELYTEGYV